MFKRSSLLSFIIISTWLSHMVLGNFTYLPDGQKSSASFARVSDQISEDKRLSDTGDEEAKANQNSQNQLKQSLLNKTNQLVSESVPEKISQTEKLPTVVNPSPSTIPSPTPAVDNITAPPPPPVPPGVTSPEPTDDQPVDPPKLTTTLVISGGSKTKSVPVDYQSKMTAWDQLNFASQTNNFSVKAKQSSLGVFIECIAGYCNSQTTGRYWFIFVNDEFSSSGASSVILEPNDVVTWKYQSL